MVAVAAAAARMSVVSRSASVLYVTD